MDAQVMHADDGIVLRLPDADLMGLDLLDQEPRTAGTEYDADQAPVGAADVVFDKGEVDQVVTDQVGGSALFASRFRECAARALLLPRRTPAGAPRCGSSASVPRNCWRWRASSGRSPSSWKPSASACRTCSTSPGWWN